MQELHQTLEDCINQIDMIDDWIYGQQYIHALNSIELFRNRLQRVSEVLLASPLFAIDENYYIQVLQGIIEAQQQEDYILFADLLKLQLRPLLIQCQAVVTEQIELEGRKNFFELNCNALKERPESCLSKQLLQSLECWVSLRENGAYRAVNLQVEPTSIGAPTLLVQTSDRSRYFHSNDNPYEAARQWVAYVNEAEEYAVFGFGLGYHVGRLAVCHPQAMITVFEPDIGVMAKAFERRDMTWLLTHPNIQLVYDPNYAGFLNKIEQVNIEVLLHYPSISVIPEECIRMQFEGIKVRLENIAVYDKQFKKNMEKNFRNIRQSAEVLKSNFQNRQVVIVAGGPSLDKNVQYLQQCNRDKVVIFATGAVLRKLLQMDIIPDYAIITDPKPYTVRQIVGLENCGVPLLLMATAIGEISETYKGDTYLVCQEGVPEAEDYAKTQNYQLFHTGGSVATTALDIAIQFGAQSIVFIGLDLAFTGNQTHASDLVSETLNSNMEYVQVPDWTGKNISTSKPFSMYLRWMEKRICEKDVTMKIYDATEGGARKQGMIPIRLIDILNTEI